MINILSPSLVFGQFFSATLTNAIPDPMTLPKVPTSLSSSRRPLPAEHRVSIPVMQGMEHLSRAHTRLGRASARPSVVFQGGSPEVVGAATCRAPPSLLPKQARKKIWSQDSPPNALGRPLPAQGRMQQAETGRRGAVDTATFACIGCV